MATNNTPTLSLRLVLEKDKLNGTNFLDWHRNLRIVLMQEMKLYVLDEPIPEEPATNAPRAQRDTYIKHHDLVDVKCLTLATMESELQKHMVDMEAFTMIARLKEMFQEQARIERFATIKALLSCKMVVGSSVSPHVLKMKGYLDHLENLGLPIS